MARLRVFEKGIGWVDYDRDTTTPPRWHIRIQRRCEYNGLYARSDWRAYREWLVWPITFQTEYEGREFMRKCFKFTGIDGRKVSASVTRCGSKPTQKAYGSPHGK